MPTALFRADASPSIGGGHVMRCLSLAEYLCRSGWRCSFAVRDGSGDTVPLLNQFSGDVVPVAGPLSEEPAEIRDQAGQRDLLVVDHYDWDHRLEKQCRSWAGRIMVIDDLADRRHDCDLLLDQTFGCPSERYANLVSENTRLLTGSTFALLRPAFAKMRRDALERRRQRPELRRILVNPGAGSTNRLTASALRAIGETGIDLAVDVVMGTADPVATGLNTVASQIDQPVQFHGFAADMADLMQVADLAVGAAGATSWERCCLGLPALMVVTADNQQLIAHELERAGAAKIIPDSPALTSTIRAELQSLAEKPDDLQQMSEAAARICDGKGVARVGQHLSSLLPLQVPA